MYRNVLCNSLRNVNLPLDALQCKDSGCQRHNEKLEVYYNDSVQSLDDTAAECVLSVKPGVHKFCWTPELDELKQQCIDISTLWASIGPPRSGCINKSACVVSISINRPLSLLCRTLIDSSMIICTKSYV